MIKRVLLEGFRKSAKGKNELSGERVYKNDLISNIQYDKTEDKIVIISSVISENLFSEYSSKIDIDKKSKLFLYTHCTCLDFERNFNKENYSCKHIVASFYRFLNDLDSDDSLKIELGINEKDKRLIKKTESSILDFLIGESNKSNNIIFEIIFNKNNWSNKISVEFKIGENKNKLYSLRDIDSFLIALANNISIPYGKDFTLNTKDTTFSPKDKRLIKFMELIKEIDYYSNSYRKTNEKLVSGKQITIPKALLREFMIIAKDFRVYLGNGFYSRILETEIIRGKIPISLSLKEIGDVLKLEIIGGVPQPIGDSSDVFIYNTLIYIPEEEQVERIMPYINSFNHSNTIFFSKKEENRVLKELIPSMQKITNSIDLSKSICNKVVFSKVKFSFYFDKSDEIYLVLKVSYGECEFNYFHDFTEKIIYRDNEKEEHVINLLRELGFEQANDKFMFFKDESYIFDFFKNDIKKLQSIGEVFYTDTFTGIKNISKSSFKGNIAKGKYNYFEMKFNIDNIPYEETKYILRSFRDNKKYYRLKSGEFLDLEEIETKKFLKLLDSLSTDEEIEENKITFNNNKGIYVADYLEEADITYLKGKASLNSLRNKLKNIKKEKIVIPKSINATLRNYQKHGYSFLKTLDILESGGILADEMGLGKTLQAITFIASNENTKTLIVAPTSLIFNWFYEFKKFAPSIKVIIINADKLKREEALNKYNDYDVLITTYNLLRIDIDLYKEIFFDYIIIDEAQNIKNSSSKISKAVKKLKSKNRFALTGTPIENSLMELWSIFDFIMPGYLYSEKRFHTKYNRRLEEDNFLIDDLNKLINPFILRRYKKDVLKELPPKIEKTFIIPMCDEQKKVYETYSKHVREIIENKVRDNEFKNSKIEILSYITKLRQIALDPSIVMEDYKGSSGKIEALMDIINSSISGGHKILLFSQFTTILKRIENIFINNNISYNYLDGSTPSNKRNTIVDNFNNNDKSVFIISLKAGGTGLNITSGDIVIHFDPWWNPAVEDQATDRAHRIGQKKVVEVIKLISEGTVEEYIINLQEKKKDLINKVLTDNNHLGEIMTNLSEDEILSLFCRK